MNNQAPPLVEIGGEIILAGHVFEVVGHTTDRNNNTVEIPGKCLRRASKQEIAEQNTHAGSKVAGGPTLPVPAAPIRPSVPRTPRQPAMGRRPRSSYGGYNRIRPKPPPIIVREDPPSLGVWVCRVAVAALVAAIVWFWSQGAEQKKWEQLHNTVPGQRR